ncbi:MAG: glycosyltransferase, partial [Wujia sp.]
GENFGHSIVEAMLMGKPVVISDQTPWTDVNGTGGFAISLNDEKAFITALEELVDMNIDKYSVLSGQIENYIKGKLNVDDIIHQYIIAFDGE